MPENPYQSPEAEGTLPPGAESTAVACLVEKELAQIADPVLLVAIRALLVPPYPVERDWDYGLPGQRYTCWTVLENRLSNTGIAYCESGFGPSRPWGLVFLSGELVSIGMDCAWYDRFEDAVREGFQLPPESCG